MTMWLNTDAAASVPKYIRRGQVTAVTVVNRGSGYTEAPTVTFDAAPEGGTTATGTVSLSPGRVTGVTITPGTGYTSAPTVSFAAPNSGSDRATGYVTVAEGKITNFVLTHAGSGYTSAPAVTLTGGGGNGSLTALIDYGKVDSITITNPGSGYTEVPDITFSAGAATAVAAIKTSRYNESIIFVDREEAQNVDNIRRGLNSPGWWKYREYTDAQGNPRYNVELKVAMDVAAADAGDTQSDDQIASQKTITITPLNSAGTMIDGNTSTITATVVSTDTSVSYVWQVKAANASSFSNLTNAGIYSGTTTKTLTITAPDTTVSGSRYRLKVSGTGYRTTYSNALTLTVTPVTIAISVQPVDVSVVEPATAEFSVTAASDTGADVSYQWQKAQSSAPTTWANVTLGSGGTTDTYTTGATAVAVGAGDTDGDKYRVVVSRTGAVSVTSSTVTLTVTAE